MFHLFSYLCKIIKNTAVTINLKAVKKVIVIVSVIIFAGTVLYGVYYLFLKRTPERLLKINFSISLKDFDYSVETFEEQWCLNGDGYAFVIYKFNKLTQENIDYLKSFGLKPLPISEEERNIMRFSKIPKEYFGSDTGFYIYKSESTVDIRNYKVFIIDAEKKFAVLYYQYE